MGQPLLIFSLHFCLWTVKPEIKFLLLFYNRAIYWACASKNIYRIYLTGFTKINKLIKKIVTDMVVYVKLRLRRSISSSNTMAVHVFYKSVLVLFCCNLNIYIYCVYIEEKVATGETEPLATSCMASVVSAIKGQTNLRNTHTITLA